MPQGRPGRGIAFHRNQANHFHRISRMRHRRAAALARRALQVQRRGRPVQARRLMQAALKVKAAAGRAGLRSRNHRARVVALQNAPSAARTQRPRRRVKLPVVKD